MKSLQLFFLIIIWMIITLFLAISVVGILAFIAGDEYWFKLGTKLIDSFIIKKNENN